MVVIDLVGNIVTTGAQSELYYYASMIHGALCVVAAIQLFRPRTAHIATATKKVNDPNDKVASFENVGAFEYVYVGALAICGLVSFFIYHNLNKESTGLVSLGSLIWSFLSLGVTALSANQFWHLKSGNIVELYHKTVQRTTA